MLISIGSFAFADGIDLSVMGYDELIELQKNLTKEIMSRPEWKEVKVPAGTWKVGDDIPAGTYAISTKAAIVTLTVYKSESKDFLDLEGMHMLTPDDTLGKLILKEGWIVEITGEVVFTPPVSLGF